MLIIAFNKKASMNINIITAYKTSRKWQKQVKTTKRRM